MREDGKRSEKRHPDREKESGEEQTRCSLANTALQASADGRANNRTRHSPHDEIPWNRCEPSAYRKLNEMRRCAREYSRSNDQR